MVVDLDPSASLLIPVPQPIGGVITVGQNQISHINSHASTKESQHKVLSVAFPGPFSVRSSVY